MPLATNTARFVEEESRPRLALARVPARHVNFLALARELSADAQLRQALQVPDTALLGVASDGVPLMIRLASPDVTHVLISGTKASGKTEALRTMLASIALYQKPHDIQFGVLDPKGTAFEFLANTPHLLAEIAITPERALQQLRWLENELERREQENIVRPRLVIAIDELEEWLAHGGREFQVHLARLAQRGRGVGISLLLCTNKAHSAERNAALRANFPVRLVGKSLGANDDGQKLGGRGDFILMAGSERVRFQAAYFPAQDESAFQTLFRENRSRASNADNTLGSLVRRLRRVK